MHSVCASSIWCSCELSKLGSFTLVLLTGFCNSKMYGLTIFVVSKHRILSSMWWMRPSSVHRDLYIASVYTSRSIDITNSKEKLKYQEFSV